MTAARKLSAVARPPAIGEDDPLWQKFITAPFDPSPAPEHETQALAAAGAFVGVGVGVDGATVTAGIARRAAAESKAKRSSR